MSYSTASTLHSVSYCGTIDSQPVKADIYYSFEKSTATTPHDIIVFRGTNGHSLATMRDRTRTYLTNLGKTKNHVFKTSLITVRADNIGRGCLYAVVPCYNKAGLSSATKAQLIQQFNKLGMREWVNNSESNVQPKPITKDRVVATINPVTYTPKSDYLSFTEAINALLKLDMVTLTNICRDNGIAVGNNRVLMAKTIAQKVKIARPVTVATEVVAAPVQTTAQLESVPERKQLMPAKFKSIPTQQLEEFVAEGKLVNLTKKQLIKLANASAYNVKLYDRMSKKLMIQLLTEAIG